MDQKPNPAADLHGRNAILFDFDGTVFDTVEGITKSIQHAIRKHGMDAELTELRCFAGPPLVDKFIEVFGVPDAEAEQLVVDFRERYVPIGVYESEPFPGIRDLLTALRQAGKTLAIATSKPQNMAELLLERSGLLDCFDVIVGSDPHLNNNAKWEVVTRAMERCNASPETAVLIGDTKYDVAGALRCGMRWRRPVLRPWRRPWKSCWNSSAARTDLRHLQSERTAPKTKPPCG